MNIIITKITKVYSEFLQAKNKYAEKQRINLHTKSIVWFRSLTKRNF